MASRNDEHRYDDIINMPHPRPKCREPMSIWDRSAQFSPFAALVGYDESIAEAERITHGKIELDNDEKRLLDIKREYLSEHINEKPHVRITYFIADERKSGGRYEKAEGELLRIGEHERIMYLSGDVKVPIDDIIEITIDRKEFE